MFVRIQFFKQTKSHLIQDFHINVNCRNKKKPIISTSLPIINRCLCMASISITMVWTTPCPGTILTIGIFPHFLHHCFLNLWTTSHAILTVFLPYIQFDGWIQSKFPQFLQLLPISDLKRWVTKCIPTGSNFQRGHYNCKPPVKEIISW